MCISCGGVGCCDNSPNKHATRHAHTTGDPIILPREPGEDSFNCYTDDLAFVLD